MNFANLLTLLRIALIPLLVVFFYVPYQWGHILTTFIFFLAAFTDWLDGYVARSYGLTSRFGEFLDPVADKLVVASTLVLLVSESQLPLLAIPAVIIVGREIVVSALREWMAELGNRASVAVSYVGKVKTSVQMLAIVLLLMGRPLAYFHHPWMSILGYAFLYLAAVLTLWTMCMYLRAVWPEISFHTRHEKNEQNYKV